MSLDIFVVCGEMSGDNLAAKILKPIAHRFSIEGIIGQRLEKIGVKKFLSIDAFQKMGFVDVFKNLPRFLVLFQKIKKTIIEKNPKIVVLVDNPDFNLLLAKALRKRLFKGKLVQLVCPSVWAWRKGRIKTIEKNFDLLLTLLPFEKDLFSSPSLQVTYIGHPLIEELAQTPLVTKMPFPSKKPTIGLFPGSRKKEISLNLPLQLKAVYALRHTYQIGISVASKKFLPLIETLAKNLPMNVLMIPFENRLVFMKNIQFALSKLGSVNLELAFFKVPTILTYPLPFLKNFFYNTFLKSFYPITPLLT